MFLFVFFFLPTEFSYELGIEIPTDGLKILLVRYYANKITYGFSNTDKDSELDKVSKRIVGENSIGYCESCVVFRENILAFLVR